MDVTDDQANTIEPLKKGEISEIGDACDARDAMGIGEATVTAGGVTGARTETSTETSTEARAGASGGGGGGRGVMQQMRMQSPRLLILLWCLWLLGSWGVTLGIESLVLATRLMVYACAFGLMLLWPVFRLSQAGRAEHAVLRVVSLDWLCLILVLQTVIWPLRLSGEWGVMQTVYLNLALASWVWLIAGIIGLGLITGKRTLAMWACVFLLLGEPALLGVLNVVGSGEWAGAGAGTWTWSWTMRISPIGALWEWTKPPLLYQVAGQAEAWLVTVVPVWLAGGLVWLSAWGLGKKAEHAKVFNPPHNPSTNKHE